jgi:hypothetical protein
MLKTALAGSTEHTQGKGTIAMGDRCRLTTSIHGHIETVEQLGKIIEALELECLTPESGPDHEDYYKQFLLAIEQNEAASFTDEQCNYAEIDAAEKALQALGMPYFVSHDEGGDYGAGCWSWSPATGTTHAPRTKEEEAYITTSALSTALANENAIEAIKALIHQCDIAEGKSLPPFTVSAAVLSHLKTQGQQS